MKDINKMSYQELVELENQIKEAKERWEAIQDLKIIEDDNYIKHLCKANIFAPNDFLEIYHDIFSCQYIATYSRNPQLPSLKEVLNDNNIPCTDYMTFKEVKAAWKQYTNQLTLRKRN